MKELSSEVLNKLASAIPHCDVHSSEQMMRFGSSVTAHGACGRVVKGKLNFFREQLMNTKTIRLFVFSLLALAAGSTIILSGCNTVEGAGKDVEAVGEATSDAARENK